MKSKRWYLLLPLCLGLLLAGFFVLAVQPTAASPVQHAVLTDRADLAIRKTASPSTAKRRWHQHCAPKHRNQQRALLL